MKQSEVKICNRNKEFALCIFSQRTFANAKKMQSANIFNFFVRLQILTSRLHSSTAGLRQ